MESTPVDEQPHGARARSLGAVFRHIDFDLLRRLPSLACALAAMSLVACAPPTAAQRVEADMASIRKESDAKTLFERGRGFAAVGDHTRAEEYLAAAIDAGADPREVLPLLMDVCVKTGRYRSAIQHGENYLRKHPRDIRTRLMVGALYAAIDESQMAREQLEQVVTTNATDEQRAQDQGVGAKAPTVDPSTNGPARLQAHAHYLLAVMARDSDRDFVKADRHFREYLRIEPNGSHAEEAKSSLLKRIQPEVQPEGGTP